MHFSELSQTLQEIHHTFAREAGRSVNIALTLRNWLFGCYIKEYELKGKDRATYGANTIKLLSEDLQAKKIPATAFSSLKKYRQFYEIYPQIGSTLSSQLGALLGKSDLTYAISSTVSSQLPITSPSSDVPGLPAEKLLRMLGFSQFAELIKIDDPLKRSFYEVECIQGHWAARELRRQISTLYYERLGLSKNKDKMAKLVETGTYAHEIQDVIREPYLFEFAGVKPGELTEPSLQKALLQDVSKFFLEMGKGFCLEDTNKKILIGDQYFFIDIVLYHRILKISVLIELKINEFKHENISQLNSYVNYYKQYEMYPGDNPPVGLLLCTEKNEALVDFALGGMDNQLLVSKYKLELPSKEEIKAFLEKRLKALQLIMLTEKEDP